MSLLTAQACAAKASLASTRSRSPTDQPAFSSALREAGIGPVPMICGSTPAVAQETMRTSGVMPRRAASASVISRVAAAPSLMPDALPAVTVPSLSKAGRSFCIASSVAPWRIYSSWSTIVSPLRPLTVTATISSLNLPAFCAASALFCEATRELVLLVAGQLPLARDVLGGVAHVIAVEGVGQAVLDHRVDHLEVAHLDAAAQMLRSAAPSTSIPGRRRR